MAGTAPVLPTTTMYGISKELGVTCLGKPADFTTSIFCGTTVKLFAGELPLTKLMPLIVKLPGPVVAPVPPVAPAMDRTGAVIAGMPLGL